MKKARSIIIYLLIGVFLLVVLVIALLTTKPKNDEGMASAPIWKGIQPGVSNRNDVLIKIAEHHSTEYRGSMEIIGYEDFDGWFRTEVWLENDVVVAVNRNAPNVGPFSKELNPEEIMLDDLIDLYGKPEAVEWAIMCNERFLIWAKSGVAANVYIPEFQDEKIPVVALFYFVPMTVEKFKWNFKEKYYWLFWEETPWGTTGDGYSTLHTLCPDDAPDTFEKDPFNWLELGK